RFQGLTPPGYGLPPFPGLQILTPPGYGLPPFPGLKILTPPGYELPPFPGLKILRRAIGRSVIDEDQLIRPPRVSHHALQALPRVIHLVAAQDDDRCQLVACRRRLDDPRLGRHGLRRRLRQQATLLRQPPLTQAVAGIAERLEEQPRRWQIKGIAGQRLAEMRDGLSRSLD